MYIWYAAYCIIHTFTIHSLERTFINMILYVQNIMILCVQSNKENVNWPTGTARHDDLIKG